MTSGRWTAPVISVSTYWLPEFPEPNWPPAVAGPTNFSVGSTASMAGTTAFHIVRYSDGVSAWPLSGTHGVSLARSGSFQGSQYSTWFAVPAGLLITWPVSVVMCPRL